MAEAIEPARLRARIEGIDRLPTVPTVVKKLLELASDPRVSIAEMSRFVSSDPALATRVLRMVNSPLHGFPERVSSVNQAVILLGVDVVKGLLLGLTVFELMQQTMIGLWEHSCATAVVARIIAQKRGVRDPEEVAVGGLLHDLGKVLLILQLPEQYEAAMTRAGEEEKNMVTVEDEAFSVTHPMAATWLMQKWSFPKPLTEMIGFHHKPHLAKIATLQTMIIHLADAVVKARGFGFSGDPFVPEVHPVLWEKLKLSDGDLSEILDEMEVSLDAMEKIAS